MIRNGSYPFKQVFITMRHSHSLVTLIETAIDRNPFCACGAPMTPVEHDGELWLECTTHDEARTGLVARISALFSHDRRLLLAREELVA
jgi:hypothetical protein